MSYFIEPIAASAAIIPTFRAFEIKSNQQLGKRSLPTTLPQALARGAKAAPTIGTIIGTQMIAQNILEKTVSKKPTLLSMFGSTAFVGLCSAPALAAFNAQTAGRTPLEAIKKLSIQQTGAIVIRETSFLFSLRISTPLGEKMKQIFGDNRAVDYTSAFTSGAIGSIVGHPADTALTLWQNGVKLEGVRQSMRGAPMKALAVGSFSVLYKSTKEFFNAST